MEYDSCPNSSRSTGKSSTNTTSGSPERFGPVPTTGPFLESCLRRSWPFEEPRTTEYYESRSFPPSTFAATSTGSHVVLNGGA